MKLTSPVALLVLLAVAGCGGGNDSFTEDYNRAVKPLSELKGDLGGGAGESNAAIAKEFDRLAGRTRATRENLAGLEPPDEAREEMAELLAGLADVTEDLSAVARATREADAVKQRKASARLVRSSGAVQRAEKALQRAVAG
jgi:hypothetical protein